MKNLLFSTSVLLLFIIAPFSSIMAQSDSLNTNSTSIVVGVAGSEPFVKDDTGVSLEIWEELMDKMEISYTTKNYNDVTDALQALMKGEVSAVAGPLSITSDRAEKVKFSQPYFESGLSILSPKDNASLWDKIAPFFSYRFFVALILLILILGVVGTLLWVTERKVNPEEFPLQPAKGIANGMWCAIVTMTTTGYGDRSPRTFWGRFVAGVWMIISLIFTTSMIAGIASVLTLSSIGTSTINDAEGLSGKKIGVVLGSPAEDFVKQFGGRTISIENVEDGFKQLSNQKMDAIVYDRPQLLYYLQQHPDYDFALSEAEYARLGYGFAFPINYNRMHVVDEKILEMEESGVVDQIINNWLGEIKK